MTRSRNKQIEALEVTKSHLTIISCGIRVASFDPAESCDTQCNQNLRISVTVDAAPAEGVIKTAEHRGYTREEEEKISKLQCSLMSTYS